MPAPAYHAPRPRPVPLLLQGAILCGGSISQIGWVLLGLGIFYSTAIAPFTRTVSHLLYVLDTKSVPGTITKSRETRITRVGIKQSGSVFAISFTFVADGKTYTGVSYDFSPSEEGPVTVEYPAGWPSVARIQGMGRTAGGPIAVLVYIVAAIGLLMALRGIRRGLPALPLLAGGVPALGTLESKKPTNLSIDRRVIYRRFYSFTAQDGRQFQAVTTDENTTDFLDENEPVLYHPRNPAHAMVVKGLPCIVRLHESGNLLASVRQIVTTLAVPAVAILGNVLFAALWS